MMLLLVLTDNKSRSGYKHAGKAGVICRYWIWIGVGYLWFFWLVLTGLTVLVLKYFDLEKSRPSIDDGASAAEQMTLQQRVTKAVSLKQLGQSELLHVLNRHTLMGSWHAYTVV